MTAVRTPVSYTLVTVYALDETSTSAFLSGPGERLPLDDMISVTSSEGEEKHIRITLMPTTFGGPSLAVPPQADPSAWGFPFHCSCWEILKASSPTSDIQVQSLFNLCRSFPIPLSSTLDFGHDYGGLYRREHLGSYPPFPGEETQLGHKERDVNSTIFHSHVFDPLDASCLVEIVGDQESSREVLVSRKPIRQTTAACDPFGKLPVEISQCIFLLLSSTDVSNLRLSSCVVANIQLPDRFWHSRFYHGREFDYIFEFARHSENKGQWRMIFLSAQRLKHHPSLVNRKRIWDLATALHDLISQTGTCHGSAIRSHFEQDAPSDARTWVAASRNLKPYLDMFSRGSRSLYERFLALPDTLSSISVSVTDLFTGRYVSGMQVTDTNGNRRNLGYFQSHGSITFATAHIVEFLLAQDQRGIRGMRVLGESGRASEWIGEHQCIPRRRLVLPKAIQRAESSVEFIKGGFDVSSAVGIPHYFELTLILQGL